MTVSILKFATPSTPIPQNGPLKPTFPVEILDRIISYIDNTDKQSLGRCMRVSSAFNAMAAPRLYNTLTLGETSGLTDPFRQSKRGVFDIPVKKAWMKKSKDKQKTQGKEKDLGYMRHLFFEGFFNLNQFPKSVKPADKGKTLQCVKSIRLIFFDNSQGEIHHRQMGEVAARFTNIEKLVLVGSSHLLKVPLDNVSSTCRRGVVVIDSYLGLFPPLDWTSKPFEHVVYVFINRRSACPQPELLKHFAHAIAHAASKAESSKTITIVNAPTYSTRNDPEKPLRDYICSTLHTKRHFEIKFSNRGRQTSDDAAPLQYPTLKYISMQEYLRDYDWSGEFTDEEIRPWLREQEAERVATYQARQQQQNHADE
jgi:hypothetical protein